MFISNTDKLHIKGSIAELEKRLASLDIAHSNLLESHRKLSAKMNDFLVHQIAQANREKSGNAPSVELEIAKHERKKSYGREYYHRKKAERLEKEAKEKAEQARATLTLQTETSQ